MADGDGGGAQIATDCGTLESVADRALHVVEVMIEAYRSADDSRRHAVSTHFVPEWERGRQRGRSILGPLRMPRRRRSDGQREVTRDATG